MKFYNSSTEWQRAQTLLPPSAPSLSTSDSATLVLILYTGGTIGMKNDEKNGYTPSQGELERGMRGSARFEERKGEKEQKHRGREVVRMPISIHGNNNTHAKI